MTASFQNVLQWSREEIAANLVVDREIARLKVREHAARMVQIKWKGKRGDSALAEQEAASLHAEFVKQKKRTEIDLDDCLADAVKIDHISASSKHIHNALLDILRKTTPEPQQLLHPRKLFRRKSNLSQFVQSARQRNEQKRRRSSLGVEEGQGGSTKQLRKQAREERRKTFNKIFASHLKQLVQQTRSDFTANLDSSLSMEEAKRPEGGREGGGESPAAAQDLRVCVQSCRTAGGGGGERAGSGRRVASLARHGPAQVAQQPLLARQLLLPLRLVRVPHPRPSHRPARAPGQAPRPPRLLPLSGEEEGAMGGAADMSPARAASLGGGAGALVDGQRDRVRGRDGRVRVELPAGVSGVVSRDVPGAARDPDPQRHRASHPRILRRALLPQAPPQPLDWLPRHPVGLVRHDDPLRLHLPLRRVLLLPPPHRHQPRLPAAAGEGVGGSGEQLQ
eukprot:33503-Hanusia_phi.AAC.1